MASRRRRPFAGRPLTLAAAGAAPAAEAWDRYARPALWTTWAPHLRRVECADERIRAGTRGTVHAVGGVRAHFVVGAVDEHRRTWSWTVRSGPIVVRLEHAVAPARSAATGARGSRTTLVLHAPRLLALAYAPLASWALRRLVACRAASPAG